MRNAEQINSVLDSLYETFEPLLGTALYIGPLEGVKTSGTYGSIILSALFTGSFEGKLTLTLEWVSGFQLAEAVINAKIERYNEEVQKGLETVFSTAMSNTQARLTALAGPVSIRVLPTLVDTNALLGEAGEIGAVKVPIHSDSGVMNLYFAFGNH